jgi:uncharacterized Zn-binding protein involved in type VI secretion
MPIPTKKGSLNTGGGIIIRGEPSVLINGRDAARVGDFYTGHPGFDPRHPHPPNWIINGAQSIRVGGRALGYLGTFEQLGHNAVPTESNVLIGTR